MGLIPAALLAPAPIRRVVLVPAPLPPSPALVAAFLSRALRGTPCADAIRRAGDRLSVEAATRDPRALDLAAARAIALRDQAAEQPEADRVPVMLALLRLLLDDAPQDRAERLDRAVTAAMRLEGVVVTAAHRETAARIGGAL